jgi:hypothetical protein
MLITELFSKDTTLTVVKDTPQEFSTRSKIAGRVIEFTAKLAAGSWLIFFVEKDPDGKSIYDTTTPTGNGAEFEVFSMVFQSLREFIKKRNPEKMDFAAAGTNRASLYRRMLKRLVGYDFTETKPQPGVSGFKIFKQPKT